MALLVLAAVTRPAGSAPPPPARAATCPSEEEAFGLAAALREALASETAQEELRKILSIHSKEIPSGCRGENVCRLRLDLAEARLAVQDPDGALTSLEGVITSCEPAASMTALRRAGRILTAQNDQLRAVNYYARYLQRADERDDAEETAETISVRKELVRNLHLIGDDRRALAESLHPALRYWSADAGADDLVLLSEIFESQRRWDLAVQALERFVNVFESDPRRLGSLVRLGKARAAMGQKVQARFLLNMVVEEAKGSSAGLEARLELLDLPEGASKVDPGAVEKTVREVATMTLDTRLASRALLRYLEDPDAPSDQPERLLRVASWGRGSPPLQREAVARALARLAAPARRFAQADPTKVLAAMVALTQTFGPEVVAPGSSLAAARAAYREGFYEIAARFAGWAVERGEGGMIDESRLLRLLSLNAAGQFDQAAADGTAYAEAAASAEVFVETCRALRALARWDDLLMLLEGESEASPEIGSRALLTLWRAEALWARGESEEAARRALVFVRAQAERAPADATDARATIARLALLAGDGYFGAGFLEDADEAYSYAESLGAGLWTGSEGRAARARVSELLPSADPDAEDGGPPQ